MEELYFDLKKENYIKIVGDQMEIKYGYTDIHRIFHQDGIVSDNINNFRLLHFSIQLKRGVTIRLMNESKKYLVVIDIFVKPDQAKHFELLRDIMSQHGCFDNMSLYDLKYGKNSLFEINKRWREEGFEETEKVETEDDIFKEKVKALPGYKVIGLSSEIEHLRTVLFEGEKLLSVISGDIDSKDTLITCTDKRVLFIESGMFSNETKEIMIGKINSVTFEQRSSYGDIRLQYGVETKEIKMVPQESIKAFVDAVHKAMDIQNQNQRGTGQTPAASVADELLKYKQLLDMGAITEEEFNKVKADLLK